MTQQDKLDSDMINQLKELLEDRFEELLERFISDGSKRMDLLREAVPNRNYTEIHAQAHGLRGSSRNIGANPLGEVCGELEERGRVESEADLETLLAAVEQEFAAVLQALNEL